MPRFIIPSNDIEWCNSELINIKEYPEKFPITKESLLSYVNILISNAATRTGVSKDTIKKYNNLFYEWLEFYFKTKRYLDVSDDSEEFNKLCLLFKVPVIKNSMNSKVKMSIGDVREKREEELLDYPENAEELLSNPDNNSSIQKNNIRSEENMIPGPKPRDNENISDNSKRCEPTDYCGIGFLPEKQIYTHKDCMEIFNKLSTEEKIKFVVNFQEVEIKLSPSDILVIKSL